MKYILTTLFFLIALPAFSQALSSGSNQEYAIKIVNHRFEPEIVEVPANQKIKLVIENTDKTIEEFESDDLKKEKLVGAGKKVIIQINPLKVGEYKFYGDFHKSTANGKIIAK